MSPRQMRIAKLERYSNPSIETFIERIRKARALGCNLSYLGLDDQTCKRNMSSRMSAIVK